MSEYKLVPVEMALPCPFCGSSNIGNKYIETYSTDSSYDTFGCKDCGARFEDGCQDDWNRRAAPAVQGEPVAVGNALRQIAGWMDDGGPSYVEAEIIGMEISGPTECSSHKRCTQAAKNAFLAAAKLWDHLHPEQPEEQSACPMCNGEGLNPLTEVPGPCANCHGEQQPADSEDVRLDKQCRQDVAAALGFIRGGNYAWSYLLQQIKDAVISAEQQPVPDVAGLVEALQNMLGAFDTPIIRRKVGSVFSEEAIGSAHAALAAHRKQEST